MTSRPKIPSFAFPGLQGVVPRAMDEEPQKFDGDKPRTDLLPTGALLEVAEVFGFGAEKYGDYNYRAGGGLDTRRLYGAALRHMFAWAQGQEYDDESELKHMAHAATCLLMILDLEGENNGT